MADRPGALVAVGNTSTVLRWGTHHVVKLLDAATPPHWAGLEAGWTASLHALGLPVPEVTDLVESDGRPGIVFRHVPGPTMLERILTAPTTVAGFGRQLADLQHEIHRTRPPDDLPRLRDRLERKTREATTLSASNRRRALAQLDRLPDGDELCHGDLHPGNIILAAEGPVVLDWFDVAIGHRCADVVRTSILIRPRVHTPAPRYLPGSSNPLLERLHRAYLAAYLERSGAELAELARFEVPVAAARLCEPGQHADLVSWLQGLDGQPTPQTAAAAAVTLSAGIHRSDQAAVGGG